jgi:hypothetical protein
MRKKKKKRPAHFAPLPLSLPPGLKYIIKIPALLKLNFKVLRSDFKTKKDIKSFIG